MSIDRLKYFATVVETKNLRKAAEIVGISPGSMSKAITTLEHELGHKLLCPDGRGISITEKGLEIYRMSATVLDEYRRFQYSVAQNESKTSKIRIATFEVFSSYFMSAFLEKNFEGSEFLLLEMAPGQIEQSILDGLVDYGITYFPSPDPALDFIEIGSFKMGIFGQKKWIQKDFGDWPFAIPITELRLHSSEHNALDMWPKQAPKRLVKFSFELMETALQTTRKGLSVLHCPDFIVKLHNDEVKSSLRLEPLINPHGYGKIKLIKTFLVSKKGSVDISMEQKLAKFFRSLS